MAVIPSKKTTAAISRFTFFIRLSFPLLHLYDLSHIIKMNSVDRVLRLDVLNHKKNEIMRQWLCLKKTTFGLNVESDGFFRTVLSFSGIILDFSIAFSYDCLYSNTYKGAYYVKNYSLR